MKGNLTEIWFKKQNHDKLVLDMQNQLNSTTNINLISHEKVSNVHSIFRIQGDSHICVRQDTNERYRRVVLFQ